MLLRRYHCGPFETSFASTSSVSRICFSIGRNIRSLQFLCDGEDDIYISFYEYREEEEHRVTNLTFFYDSKTKSIEDIKSMRIEKNGAHKCSEC